VRRVAAVALLVLATGCTAAGPAHDQAAPGKTPAAEQVLAGSGSASVGALRVFGAYVREPAAPDVAAAYLRVTNTGDVDDVLLAVTTPLAMGELHRGVVHDGKRGMEPVASVPVPAGGTTVLRPGELHVMLMHVRTPLHRGMTVPLTLRFAKAGTVTVTAPVLADQGAPTPTGTPAMGGMTP
jgi:copper(I)-binding protein